MISALAAVAAVGLAVTEGRYSRANRQVDRRRDLYQRVVLDPLVAALPEFAEAIARELEGGAKRVASRMDELLPHAQLLEECKATVDRFNELFFRSRVIVRLAMVAWSDEGLSGSVDRRMQDLQDAVVQEVRQLATDAPPSATRLVSVVYDSVARVLQVLVAYEPTMPEDGRPRYTFRLKG